MNKKQREAVKKRNKNLHKKFLKSGKARTAFISVIIAIILYICGALGFIEIDEARIDSILESVETISDQITNIKEMIQTSNNDDDDEEEEGEDEQQQSLDENEENDEEQQSSEFKETSDDNNNDDDNTTD